MRRSSPRPEPEHRHAPDRLPPGLAGVARFGAGAPTVRLDGEARTGAGSRAARFEFTRTSNACNATGASGVSVELPRYETLTATFDFDRDEAPDANAGIRASLEGSPGTAARFALSGWIGVADDRPFGFGLHAARRNDAAGLASPGQVLRPLTMGRRG